MTYEIAQKIRHITASLPEYVHLVAVSKFHPVEKLREAYDAGQRLFGESHALEMQEKAAALPSDIRWHFIGHLQTNKVKFVVPVASLIHSVDSVRLLREIDKQAKKIGKVQDILLQIHVAQEDTKYGFTPDECIDLFASAELSQLNHVRTLGLMCMASNVEDEAQISREFSSADSLFCDIKQRFCSDISSWQYKSWGMSHDYPIAIAHGSNIIRVGTMIFGDREY